MKGAPPSSSVRPGASPTIMRRASSGPDPITTRCRVAASPQRVHVDISSKSLTSVHEDSRDARAQACENLPRDGVPPFGQVAGAHHFAPLAPDQDHVVAWRDVIVTHVNDDLIHGDVASDAVALCVNENLGASFKEVSGVTVGVPEGHGDDGGVTFQRTTTAIAGASPRFDAMNGHHLSAKRQGG